MELDSTFLKRCFTACFRENKVAYTVKLNTEEWVVVKFNATQLCR